MLSEVKEFFPRVKAEEGQQEEEPVSLVVFPDLKSYGLSIEFKYILVYF